MIHETQFGSTLLVKDAGVSVLAHVFDPQWLAAGSEAPLESNVDPLSVSHTSRTEEAVASLCVVFNNYQFSVYTTFRCLESSLLC